MTTAFNPAGGLPRLLRFVPADKMPSRDTLTIYDKQYNLLVINQELYETLDATQQHITQRAQTTLVLDPEYA